MKRKELLVVNAIIISLVVFFGALTVGLSVNDDLATLIKGAFGGKDTTALQQIEKEMTATCSKKQALALTGYSKDPYLGKLQQYQELCGSQATNRMMLFTSFSDNNTAAGDAAKMAAQLKTFAAAKVSPIVIAEPYVGDGPMSYKTYLSGAYDAGMNTYFQKLKDAGVTDQMMGLWVPFPESNTPLWNNKDTEPRDFSLSVNKYVSTMKKYFPKAKASVLLSATTYDPNDLEYNNGDYISLVPYLQEITRGSIDSIGIQGFPWVSNAQAQRREIFKAAEFLQPELAIEAARELRIRDIWYNTGSFAAKYTQDDDRRVNITANERKAILADILTTAESTQDYQQNEYRVFVNLFSEDKSEAGEATDWSYFQSTESKTILKDFLTKANDRGVPVTLYDKTK
ncbi:MAG TPA: hypothetical protein VD735_02280 [Candidatus Saccharimonadales bacterium]|nr:hypothetical protein [Candidatus Saccharimonadales bacterium]